MGHYKELFEQVRKKGYLYVRVDGEVCEALPGMKLDRYKNHAVLQACVILVRHHQLVYHHLSPEQTVPSTIWRNAISLGNGCRP